MDRLRYNLCFEGAKEVFKPSCQSFTTRATNYIMQTKNINKFRVDLKAAVGKPIKLMSF